MDFIKILAAMLPFLPGFITPTTSVPKITPTAEVYFLPHQDDEMFMAGSIKRSVDAGHEVYAVLVTDGSQSRVFEYLKKKYYPLTREEFSMARDRELLDSLVKLGLPSSHVYFAHSTAHELLDQVYKDGRLTEVEAARLVDFFYKQFGNKTTYITLISSRTHRQHSDHYALSQALLHDVQIQRKRFFSEDPHLGQLVSLSKAELAAKQQALRAYSVWDPKRGRYAVGGQSVEDLLDFWGRNPFEYIVTYDAAN